MTRKKASPSWSDVKTRLTDFDRAGLLGLRIRAIYQISRKLGYGVSDDMGALLAVYHIEV